MSETNTVATASGELLLDPFSYHPQEASAIRGLGGEIKPTDPTYALHTDYVRVAEGPANFTLRFQGLTGKLGTLQLRVHMFVEGPPARFLLANTVRTQFNRLIQLGSEIAVRFEGIKGVQFALHGAVLGESDAQATGLTVTLDRPAPAEGDEAVGTAADLRNTDFGLSSTKAVPLLLSVESPTLASPVSQLATVAQLREPACAEWRDRLGPGVAEGRAAWCAAYVLQALRAYGLLQEGARGVGFGQDAATIATVARSFGAEVQTAELPEMHEHLPGSLSEFDFLWTIDAAAAYGVGEASGYVEGLMRCLRPGGLAVHVVPFMPGRLQRREDPATVVFRRGEIERLAFTMIARATETAQLKVDDAAPLYGDAATGLVDVGAFGLIFRREPLTGIE